MTSSRPAWLPKDARLKEQDGDRVAVYVDVRQRPHAVEFGHVPDNTHLILELRGGGQADISAERVGSGVVLQISRNRQGQPVTVEDFFTVRLDRGSARPAIIAGRRRLIVELHAAQFKIHGSSKPVKVKSAGNCTVEGPGNVLEAELDGGHLNLQCGLEPESSISGNGKLTVHGGLTQVAADFDGHITVEGTAKQCEVSSTGLHVKGTLSDTEATVAGAVHVERDVVNSAVETRGEGGGIQVGGSQRETPFDLNELPLDAEPDSWPDPATKEPPHGKVKDSTLDAQGDVACKQIESSRVSTTANLQVRVDVLGQGTELRAGGHIFIGGDVAGPCQITAHNAAVVGDLGGAASLTCQGTANVHVADATVVASELRLRGADSGHVEVHEDIHIVEEVSAECPLILRGAGTVQAHVLSEVTWEPVADAEVDASAPIKTLIVNGSGATLTTSGAAALETLQLDGELHLAWSAGQDSSGIHVLDSSAAGTATLTVHLTQQLTVREVLPPRVGPLEIKAVDGDDVGGHLHLEQVRPGSYDLSAIDKVLLHLTCDGGTGDGTSEQEVGETNVEVRAATRIILSGEVTTLTSQGTPVLTVQEDGAVRDLRGTWQLGSVEGRVYGGSYTTREGAEPPRITAIHKQADGKGQVAGIDPTNVPFPQLSELAKLHIFDPEAAPLKELAKNIPEDRMDRLQRSEVAHRIAEIVSERASSGSTRSAARWAAARLHHATALTRHERLLRTFHRAVGYSQRPGPAALTWLLTALSLGLLSAAHRSGGREPLWTGEPWSMLWESRWWEALTSWGHASVELLFLPARLFRFTAEEGGDVLLFGSALWHVLAFVAVGLPFLFCVLALRNFLISPVDD